MITRAIAVSLLMVVAGLSGLPASAATNPSVQIDYPANGGKVAAGDLEIRGSTDGGPSSVTNVLYAVDVSGSTAWYTGYDCDGDGVSGSSSDDLNQDGNVGDILDCEIGAVATLNASLRSLPNAASKVRVGLVPFGNSAAIADVHPDAGEQTWVPPGATGSGKDLIPYVEMSAASMTQGVVDLYTQHYVGTGTDFNQPLASAVTAFAERSADAKDGPAWVFFLSDGQASLPDMSAAVAAGIKIKTFAVNQPSCNAELTGIATATGQTCTAVPDPSALPDSVLQADSSLLGVDVTLTGAGTSRTVPATIDALGNFKAAFGNVSQTGQYQATARARFVEGATATSSPVSFSVSPQKKYVALGDSYSSGEGVEPFIDQRQYRDWGKVRYDTTEGFLCHRSTASWPSMVTWPGTSQFLSSSDPDLFTFKACSGARLPNLDTQEQDKRYYGCPAFNARGGKLDYCYLPLQLRHLGSDVDLVTLTIGGNDLGFSKIVEQCILSSSCMSSAFVSYPSGGSTVDVTLQDWARLRLALIQKELKGVFTSIRERVGKKAVVVAATYPYLFDTGQVCTASGVAEDRLSAEERTWLAKGVDEFADRLALISRQNPGLGLTVADVRSKFTKEHSPCGNGEQWLYGRQGQRATDLDQSVKASFVSAASYHPNSNGVAAYANVVNQALQQAVSQPAKARTQARAADPEDPDAVIAGYPAAMVQAVDTTSLVDLAVGSVAATKDMAYCEAVVGSERVPIAAEGFQPGSQATATLQWDGASVPLGQLTADAAGRVSAEVVVPPTVTAAKVATLRLAGTNSQGGPAVGLASLEVTSDAGCVEKVRAAGALNAKAKTGISVTVSKHKVALTKPVTITATLSGPSAGTVAFRDNAHRLGTANVTGGKATLKTRKLAGGKQSLTATFAGDDRFDAASSSVKIRVIDKQKPKLRVSVAKGKSRWRASDQGWVKSVRIWERVGTKKFVKVKTPARSGRMVKGKTDRPHKSRGKRVCVRVAARDWAGNGASRTDCAR